MNGSGKETLVYIGLTTAIIAGGGLVGESHTNEIATRKADTAEACVRIYGTEQRQITAQVIACIDKPWIPGGKHIDTTKFTKGSPIEFVDEYIKIQREEAKQVEAHRILFSLGVYGVMYLGIWLYTDSRSLTSSNNVSGVHKMGLEEEEL